MAEAFAIGDTVQLKSGGEVMTVEALSGSDVDCVWSQDKKVERGTFVAATLRKFDQGW
jgi:uncharacterized protein YodC (DUF2158 family)